MSLCTQHFYGRHNVSRKSVNHLSVLMHDVISLPDGTSYGNNNYQLGTSVRTNMTTCNISRTKYVMSIGISHIFRSKYCFFSIRTRGLSCAMRSLVSICALREILNSKETIYTYKKAIGKITREILYKIVSKVFVLQC